MLKPQSLGCGRSQMASSDPRQQGQQGPHPPGLPERTMSSDRPSRLLSRKSLRLLGSAVGPASGHQVAASVLRGVWSEAKAFLMLSPQRLAWSEREKQPASFKAKGHRSDNDTFIWGDACRWGGQREPPAAMETWPVRGEARREGWRPPRRQAWGSWPLADPLDQILSLQECPVVGIVGRSMPSLPRLPTRNLTLPCPGQKNWPREAVREPAGKFFPGDPLGHRPAGHGGTVPSEDTGC